MVGAVIYVRVSMKEQTENLSLPTQLRACEEYCRRQCYEILERFHEEGESAKSTDRSQLQNLLTFCRLNKGRVPFVVVFNLTRFARDKYDHFALRSHLQSLGISLRSATEPIDDTSTGKLMEGVLAAFAQFDNDVRSDRTRAGMKAALELGRWVFLAPIGYLNAPRSMGKSLIHDPERAALVRRAFEEYATGRLTKEQLLKACQKLGASQIDAANRSRRRRSASCCETGSTQASWMSPSTGFATNAVTSPRSSRRISSTASSRSSPGECRARHRVSARIPTFRCAASFAASHADAASPAAGRRGAASTTPTTIAALAAAR
jgi:DNA invertase Pin-like site-specific DNA recombinase